MTQPESRATLGTLLRALLDGVEGGVDAACADAGLECCARHIPAILRLGELEAVTVRTLAADLGVAPSAASRTLRDLRRRGWGEPAADDKGRAGRLRLTPWGRSRLPALERAWRAADLAAAPLVAELGLDLMAALAALQAIPFRSRIAQGRVRLAVERDPPAPPGGGPASRATIISDLAALGVRPGDTVMVHASLRRVGPVCGGPAALAEGLLEAVGPAGTLLAYVAWDRSPYEETLNGAVMPPEVRAAWPTFDPETAGVYLGFGALNVYLAKLPGARRSGHPDASMLAIGAAAEHLAAEHPLESAYGPGSPLERFLELEGKVLLLGAQPDALTVLHYAEAIAPIPHKRRVSYEMPVLDAQGRPEWRRVEDFDSNGVLDIYAAEGGPDAVERIGREYLRRDRHREGRVGAAAAQLIDARDLVRFGVAWLVARHGGERG